MRHTDERAKAQVERPRNGEGTKTCNGRTLASEVRASIHLLYTGASTSEQLVGVWTMATVVAFGKAVGTERPAVVLQERLHGRTGREDRAMREIVTVLVAELARFVRRRRLGRLGRLGRRPTIVDDEAGRTSLVDQLLVAVQFSLELVLAEDLGFDESFEVLYFGVETGDLASAALLRIGELGL